MICSSCGTTNEAGRKFCGECGTRLAVACPNCGTANAPTAKFCGECATPLAGATAPAAGATTTAETSDEQTTAQDRAEAASAVAERRLVSILFADLVGFTTFSEGRDAEEVRETLSRYFELASDVIGRHGG